MGNHNDLSRVPPQALDVERSVYLTWLGEYTKFEEPAFRDDYGVVVLRRKAMNLEQHYRKTGQELERRIVALIPDHPEILEMDEPWGLFEVSGFCCADLGPTLNQATFALKAAQREFKSRT